MVSRRYLIALSLIWLYTLAGVVFSCVLWPGGLDSDATLHIRFGTSAEAPR